MTTKYKQPIPTYQSTPLVRPVKQTTANILQPASLMFNTVPVTSQHHQMHLPRQPIYNGLPTPKLNTVSVSKQLNNVDNDTVQRQRRELQLMIQELKERDKELNDLVHSHHQQLVSWESDRLRLQNVEKQLNRYKTEYRKRHEQCKILKERLKHAESGVSSKYQELQSTQLHLKQLSAKANISSNHVEELMVKNQTLQSSVADLTSQISLLASKEQQMATSLRLKDKDISNANRRIEELTSKLQRTNNVLHDYKKEHTNSKIELEKARSQNISYKLEVEKLQKSVHEQSVSDDSHDEIIKVKQDFLVLQKELLFSGEREKRKDSLLELAKSKQERTDTELSHLRKLYSNLVNSNDRHDDQDDRFSVFTLSGHESMTQDQMDVLNSSTNSILLSSITLSESRKDEMIIGDKGNDTLGSFASEDIGEMDTGELKEEEVEEAWQQSLEEQDLTLEDDFSPTTRLHRLLTESRQMIKNLEESPTLANNQSTPELKYNDSVELCNDDVIS